MMVSIPIIRKASLSTKQTISLYVLFSLSFLSIASTVTRLVLQIIMPTSSSHIFWACLETLSVAVVCNAPMLSPLLEPSSLKKGSAKSLYQRKSQQLSMLTLNFVGAVRGKRPRRFGNTSRVETTAMPYTSKGAMRLNDWTDEEALVSTEHITLSSKGCENDLSSTSHPNSHSKHKPSTSLTSLDRFAEDTVFVTREVHVDSETLRSYGDGSSIRNSYYGGKPGNKSQYRVKDYEKWMGTVRETAEEVPPRPLRSLSQKKTHRLKISNH